MANVNIAPKAAKLAEGQRQSFKATDDAGAEIAATWSISPRKVGTITQGGALTSVTFTAPERIPTSRQ